MKHPRKLGLQPGTPEYVIQHALYQKSRGRGMACTYRGERNPTRAHAKALSDWCESPAPGFRYTTPQILSVLRFGGHATSSPMRSSNLEIGADLKLTTHEYGMDEVFNFTVTGKVPHIGAGDGLIAPVVFCGIGSSSEWPEYDGKIVVVGIMDDSGVVIMKDELPDSQYFDRCEAAYHALMT